MIKKKSTILILITLVVGVMTLTGCDESSSGGSTSASGSTSSEEATTDNELAYEPFINIDYFDFSYGDTDAGERLIDSQYVTDAYFNTTGESVFGVNFADGRIKGYGLDFAGGDKTFLVMYVREIIQSTE